MLREIRDLGFEYAELSHGIRISLLPGVLEAFDAGEIKISTLHNFCPLPMGVNHAAPNIFKFSSEDRRERENAYKHTLKTIETAERVKAPLVVLHMGAIDMKDYMDNVYTMEQLTRTQTNLALLRKHQADYLAAGKKTIDVEMLGVRIGDFALVTFPGELTVRIGLNIKKKSPHELTFVAGYTNGYIYYSPTAEQLQNVGGAQEDSDCILAPEWQALFETRAAEILKKL